MDDHEWLGATDPTPMLQFLRGKVTKRKFRLFACACWRRVWPFLATEEDRQAIIIAERFADGLVHAQDLPEAFDKDGRSAWPHVCYPADSNGHYDADLAGYLCAAAVAESVDAPEGVFAAERASQAELVRDIFGPLQPVCVPSNASWVSLSVMSLAATVYEERAYDYMPILADALEDAGCQEVDILAHCRQAGEHARGCWVVDLLLGKE